MVIAQISDTHIICPSIGSNKVIVEERISASGDILIPLNKNQIKKLIKTIFFLEELVGLKNCLHLYTLNLKELKISKLNLNLN